MPTDGKSRGRTTRGWVSRDNRRALVHLPVVRSHRRRRPGYGRSGTRHRIGDRIAGNASGSRRRRRSDHRLHRLRADPRQPLPQAADRQRHLADPRQRRWSDCRTALSPGRDGSELRMVHVARRRHPSRLLQSLRSGWPGASHSLAPCCRSSGRAAHSHELRTRGTSNAMILALSLEVQPFAATAVGSNRRKLTPVLWELARDQDGPWHAGPRRSVARQPAGSCRRRFPDRRNLHARHRLHRQRLASPRPAGDDHAEADRVPDGRPATS